MAWGILRYGFIEIDLYFYGMHTKKVGEGALLIKKGYDIKP